MAYYIKDDITNETLIKIYKFKEIPWTNDKHNLEIKDDKHGLGLQIWWADRSVRIILGEHGTYGIAPIPKTLIKLYNDGVLIKKEK